MLWRMQVGADLLQADLLQVVDHIHLQVDLLQASLLQASLLQVVDHIHLEAKHRLLALHLHHLVDRVGLKDHLQAKSQAALVLASLGVLMLLRQKRYEASTKPKTTYKTPGPNGVAKPIAQNSPQVQSVRRYVTHERYVTYDNRASAFYGSYYSRPYYYQDSFSPFLMGWLLSDVVNSHDRALWAYHHQSDMDQTRYNELLQRDANLQAEINQLKSQNVPIDPSYVPPQMSNGPDLMYDKDFVDASYNPIEVEPKEEGKIGKIIFWMFFLFAGGVVMAIGTYFMFVKEY